VKKKSKKLSLSRETLHQLDERRAQVAGASSTCDYDNPGNDTGPVWTGPFYGTCPSSYC